MGALRKSVLVRAATALVGGGALIIGMVTAAAGPASASPLPCGTTVTANVTLTANVDCTSNTTDNGINIGAPDVTVNLNGHSILGPGTSAGTVGVSDIDAFDNVTVKNGSISNFAAGVDAEGTSSVIVTGIVVEKIHTTNNEPQEGVGVFGEYLNGASIHNLSISSADVGVELENSESSTILNNQVTETYNGFEDAYGTDDNWSDNTLTGVYYDGFELEDTTGAVVDSDTIKKGYLSAEGVYQFDSSDSTISANTWDSLFVGLEDYNSVTDVVSHNIGSGDLWGVYSNDLTNPTFLDNQFNNGKYGIETDFPSGAVFQGNVTNHNTQVGVFVYTDDETSSSYSAMLANNTANDNKYGLYSEIPTTGHPNHASGNTAVNCHNVHCVKATAKGKAPASRTRDIAPAPLHLTFRTIPRPAGAALRVKQ